MATRLAPNDRKKEILDAAVKLARHKGYTNVTRDDVARGANCSAALVSRYFSTMTKLRHSVMRAAVHGAVYEVIAQGLACKDRQAMKAPAALKQQALATLVN
jgi:AcrR family transcriptional regulator